MCKPQTININRTNKKSNTNRNLSEEPQPNCVRACCSEFYPCQPWFSIHEPSTHRNLDVSDTFGPFGLCPVLLKLGTSGYVVFTQVQSWLNASSLSFYYAYYTSWAMGFATLYSLLSFANSNWPVKLRSEVAAAKEQRGRGRGRGDNNNKHHKTRATSPVPEGADEDEEERLSLRARFTWIVFNLAVFSQFMASLIFWTLVHDYSGGGDKVKYLDVATHGLVFLTVCIDGFVISRIPLRWMHLWLSWAFLGMYLVWTIVHSVLDIGNPNEEDNDEATNDDAIYANLVWDSEEKAAQRRSVILAMIVFVVVSPLLFGILRACSVGSPLYCCCCGKNGSAADRRRYDGSDTEMGYRWI